MVTTYACTFRLKAAGRGQSSGLGVNRHAAFQARVPEDDVWFRVHYSAPHHALVNALDMHREYAAPDMSNRPNAVVQARLKLNMAGRKKVPYVLSHSFSLSLTYISLLSLYLSLSLSLSPISLLSLSQLFIKFYNINKFA